ncbi:MAG: hypothetical protein VX000_01330, partial [Myxococcota bacterium]|nr:hypothetical protein [Myxococcota bacterium]
AREAGAGLRVWRAIKAEWDPDGRMNPGRPFPADAPEPDGPDGPAAPGPVFEIDALSRLARVDPAAHPSSLEAALAESGFALRIIPDRPLGEWIPALYRGVLDRWNAPFFGVQARFEDGVSVRLGPAPRSAAGPDLRQALLRRATAEWVEVPIVPLGHGGMPPWHIRRPPVDGPTAEDARPTWRRTDAWGFLNASAAAALDGEAQATAPIVAPGPGLRLRPPQDAS